MKANKVIKSAEEYLIKRFGKVNDEWILTLKLLEDNINLYEECKKSIKLNGIYDSNTGKKNPLLTTVKDLQATIIKEIQHLGLTPYAAYKIKDTEEDDSDLLKNIMGEDE